MVRVRSLALMATRSTSSKERPAAAAAPAAYYLLWVLGILLFAELVYHTTRLM